MGVALVPGSLRKLGRSGVRYVPLQGRAPTIETGLVWRKDDATPTVSRLVEIARLVSSKVDRSGGAGTSASLPGGAPAAILRNNAVVNGAARPE